MSLRKSTKAIVLHCTATLANQPHTVASIRAMHKARGFSDIGYHFLIGINGETWKGRAMDQQGAGVQGFNAETLHVAYVGGLRTQDAKPTDTRTDAQQVALVKLLQDMVKAYPRAVILGHRDFSKDLDGDGKIEPSEWMKACPCFDAGPWAKQHFLPGAVRERGQYVRL